ncbi:otoraplin [Cynoglossus semilaevis]|uniref:Otoraplin n=1 Tax=Cynoglossus semilaevis TaxID=244447 RepID=A0A3P8WG93_CYNSE|nr:otoraplin [Cynoglossus semilaevis]
MPYPPLLLLLLFVGLWSQTGHSAVMDKLADNKICGDVECSYVLSLATALNDFIAPDCRFINIRKGQMCICYSHLQVYGHRYVDQIGIMGYFPATVVKETHKFTTETVKIPTTDGDFYCD